MMRPKRRAIASSGELREGKLWDTREVWNNLIWKVTWIDPCHSISIFASLYGIYTCLNMYLNYRAIKINTCHSASKSGCFGEAASCSIRCAFQCFSSHYFHKDAKGVSSRFMFVTILRWAMSILQRLRVLLGKIGRPTFFRWDEQWISSDINVQMLPRLHPK